MREQEGFIPVGEYRVWYRIVGGGAAHEDIPLLTLHGGPGIPHDYILDMAALASDTRRVIFYDQLGCGRSDQPNNPSLWTIERTVAEIDTVRRALITSGRYDESTPLLNEVLHNGIAGSEWVLFEQSSHMAHVEERELYLSTVKAFIEGVEAMLK